MGPRIDSLLPLTRILASAPPLEAPPPAGPTPEETGTGAAPAEGLIPHQMTYAKAIINYNPDTKVFSGSLVRTLASDWGLTEAEVSTKLSEKNVLVLQPAKGKVAAVQFTGANYAQYRQLADKVAALDKDGTLRAAAWSKIVNPATSADDAKRTLDAMLTVSSKLDAVARKGLVDKCGALNRGDAAAVTAFGKEFEKATKGKWLASRTPTAMRTQKDLKGDYLPDVVDFAIGAAHRMADVAMSMAAQRLGNETDQATIEAKANEILRDPTVISEADAKQYGGYTVAEHRAVNRTTFEVRVRNKVDAAKTETEAQTYVNRLHGTSVKLKNWAAANKVKPEIIERYFRRIDNVTVTISQRKCGKQDGDLCVGGELSAGVSTGIRDGGGATAAVAANLSHRFNDVFNVGVALGAEYARKNMGLTDYGTFFTPQNPGQDFKFTTGFARLSLWGNKEQPGGLTVGGGLFMDGVEEYPWAGIFLDGVVGPFATDGKEFSFKFLGGVKGLFARAPYQLSEEDINGEIDYTGASINAGIELSFLDGALILVANYANLIESTDDESGDAEGNIHQFSGKIAGKVGGLWVPMAKVVYQDRFEPMSFLKLTVQPAHFQVGPVRFGPSYIYKRTELSGALLQAGDATNPVDCQGKPPSQCTPTDAGTALWSRGEYHRLTAHAEGEVELSSSVTLEFAAELGWEGARRYINDTEGAGLAQAFFAGGSVKLGFGTTKDERSDPVRTPGEWFADDK